MSSLTISYAGEKHKLDEFFKSLMFQRIMDGDFNRNERDTMLVIFRKTLHFDKPLDRLGIHWLSKSVGIGEHSIRKTIRQLEAKGLIKVERSKGGQVESSSRFNGFSLGDELILLVVREWVEVKREHGYSTN